MTEEEQETRGNEIDERTDVLLDLIHDYSAKYRWGIGLTKSKYMEIVEAHEEIAKLMREITTFPTYQGIPDE